MPFGTRGIGEARGRITIDTSGITKAKNAVQSAARSMSSSLSSVSSSAAAMSSKVSAQFDRITAAAQKAKQAAENFDKTRMGALSAALSDITKKLQGVSLAAGGIVAGGTMAVQHIKRLNLLFEALTGSQEKANEKMAELRALADKTNQPFLELVSSATSLLPAIGRSNVDLTKTIQLAQRLAILDPAQGMEGAAYAIRELLSGTYTSLASRFEMSRTELQKLVAEAEGDPAKIIAGLDEMVNKMGLTNEALEDMGKSGVAAFGILKSEVTEAAATAFAPFVNDILIPLVKGFSAFFRNLRESNPEVLRIAGAFAVATAAAVPLLTAINGLITAYKALQMASAAGLSGKMLAAAGMVGKGAALAGAGYVGIQSGGAITRGLANAGVGDKNSDFERIRKGEDPLAIAGERFKQVILILVDGILYLGKMFALGATWIMNAIDQMINVFKLAGTYVSEFFSRFVMLLGDIIYGIGELLSGVMDTTSIKEAGLGVKSSGETGWANAVTERSRLETRLAQGLTIPQEELDRIEANYTQLRTDVVGGLNDFFFGTKEAVDEGFQEVEEVVEEGLTFDFTEDQLDAFQEFQEDMADIEADYQEQREEALEEHEDEKTKLAKKHSDELLKLVEDEGERRKEAERRLSESIAEVHEEAAVRVDDAYKDLDQDIADAREEARKEQQKADEEFRREEKKRLRDHRHSLLELAANLDARAIFFKIRDFRNETKERQKEKKRQDAERAAELEEEIAQMRQQTERELAEQAIADERRIAKLREQFVKEEALEAERFAKRTEELIRQQNEETAIMLEKHKERMDKLIEQEDEAIAALEDSFVDTFNKLAEDAGQHGEMMIGIQQDGNKKLEEDMIAWWARQKSLRDGILTDPTKPGSTTANGTGTTTGGGLLNLPPAPGGDKQMVQHLAGSNKIFKTGVYKLEAGEAVIRKDVNRMMSRMGTGANQSAFSSSSGPSASIGPKIGNLTQHIMLGDIGNRSDEQVKSIFYEAMVEFLEEFE